MAFEALKIHPFEELVQYLVEELGKDDCSLQKLKFLCQEKIGDQQKNDNYGALDLIEELNKLGLFTETVRRFFVVCLAKIGRHDLARRANSALEIVEVKFADEWHAKEEEKEEFLHQLRFVHRFKQFSLEDLELILQTVREEFEVVDGTEVISLSPGSSICIVCGFASMAGFDNFLKWVESDMLDVLTKKIIWEKMADVQGHKFGTIAASYNKMARKKMYCHFQNNPSSDIFMEEMYKELERTAAFEGGKLHRAILDHDPSSLGELLETADLVKHVDAVDSYGRTALMAACLHAPEETVESVACVQLLLDSGAKTNTPSTRAFDSYVGQIPVNTTPLHVVAGSGKLRMAKLILHASTDSLDAKDNNGKTPENLANENGMQDCVQYLRGKSDEKLQIILIRARELFTASSSKRSHNSGDTNRQSLTESEFYATGDLILPRACEDGYVDIVKALLDHGTNINSKLFENETSKVLTSPLHASCRNGHIEIVQLLLKHDPNLSALLCGDKEHLPIHEAVTNGHADIVEFLLSFNYNQYYKNGNTLNNNGEAFEAIKKISPEEVDGKMTAANQASEERSPDVTGIEENGKSMWYRKSVSSMVSSPPFDVNQKDKLGHTPLYIACIAGYLDVVKVLLSPRGDNCPVDVNCVCNGCTPLIQACINNNDRLTSILLKHGADPNLSIEPESKPVAAEDSPSVPVAGLSASALVKTCNMNPPNLKIVSQLLHHGAKDIDKRCLSLANLTSNRGLLFLLLANSNVHSDSDYKINYKMIPNLRGAPIRSVSAKEYSGFVESPDRKTEQLTRPKEKLGLSHHSKSRKVKILRKELSNDVPFPDVPVAVAWCNKPGLCKVEMEELLAKAVTQINPLFKGHITSELLLHVITRLNLSDNALEVIAPCIFRTASLRKLNLSDNKLKSLPESSDDSSVWQCTALEKLDISNNELTSLPSVIFELPDLWLVKASRNCLKSLPFAMWMASSLKKLDVSRNEIDNLPCEPEFCRTGALSEGISCFNSLFKNGEMATLPISPRPNSALHSRSPSRFFRFFRSREGLEKTYLTLCNMWSQRVLANESFSDPIEDKKAGKLTNLNLSYNQLKSVPLGLPCLAPKLGHLDMSHNQLTEIGAPSQYPESLCYLFLSHNKIASLLPKRLGSTTLPNFVKENSLPLLTFNQHKGWPLSMSNQVALCKHRVHKNLAQLSTLDVSHNILNSLKSIISGEADGKVVGEIQPFYPFPKLVSLKANNNEISSIPSEIEVLKDLGTLYLDNNKKINSLPFELGLLSKMYDLSLKGCNLEEPFSTRCLNNMTQDLLGYLKSTLEGSEKYRRMKLMFVGKENVGKTTLLKELRSKGTVNKPTEEWVGRQGEAAANQKAHQGGQLSTVGIDLCDWTYAPESSKTKVTFSTWDFAGQKVYHASHQYFLTKRSLYLVIWSLEDGERGIEDMRQWLVNIQCQAPQSPVIIVGTHYDTVAIDDNGKKTVKDLEQIIRERFMDIPEKESKGLPDVKAVISVGCLSTRLLGKKHKIDHLRKLIYDTAFSLKLTVRQGLGKTQKVKLLDQDIPAIYLALEETVVKMLQQIKDNKKKPILKYSSYVTEASDILLNEKNKSFRDKKEFKQATKFLYENGVLLYFEDAGLSNYVFLDPQWLCDMMSKVVTVEQVNPWVDQGIMKISDLGKLYEKSGYKPEDINNFIVHLLNKFEVAVPYDSEHLAIPSCMPTYQEMATKVFPTNEKSFSLSVDNKEEKPVHTKLCQRDSCELPDDLQYAVGGSSFYLACPESQFVAIPGDPSTTKVKAVTFSSQPHSEISRLYLMQYLPSGFWSRLITKHLGEGSLREVAGKMYLDHFTTRSEKDVVLPILKSGLNWACWQTGMKLVQHGSTLLSISQVHPDQLDTSDKWKMGKMVLWSRGKQYKHDLRKWQMVAINVASNVFYVDASVKSCDQDKRSGGEETQRFTFEPSHRVGAKLLSIVTDIIDTLLEDWYPSIGEPLLQTVHGELMVMRIVPSGLCSASSARCKLRGRWSNGGVAEDDDVSWNRTPTIVKNPVDVEISSSLFSTGFERKGAQKKNSKESIEGSINELKQYVNRQESIDEQEQGVNNILCGFLLEECLLQSTKKNYIKCPTHGKLELNKIAPDLTFQDLEGSLLVDNTESDCSIKHEKWLGSGAFGSVFKGSLIRGDHKMSGVAIKMLEPFHPGEGAPRQALLEYEHLRKKREADELRSVCQAYRTTRKELSIIQNLRHSHIVDVLGFVARPLSILMELAPEGCLSKHLEKYKRVGTRLPPLVVHKIAHQIADALNYLHGSQIIHRDLKGENILVWSLPGPEDSSAAGVKVKLADYGISRTVLPTGTKGLQGTPGYIAPEIVKYRGHEYYTKKVDCFSFGMLLYELISLHSPYEELDSAILVNQKIINGEWPMLYAKEAEYPTHILDLMMWCWNIQPSARPSAGQLVKVTGSPEFSQLLEVGAIHNSSHPSRFVSAFTMFIEESEDTESESSSRPASADLELPAAETSLWVCLRDQEDLKMDIFPYTEEKFQLNGLEHCLPSSTTERLCAVGETVWMALSSGHVNVMSADTCQSLGEDFPVIPNTRQKIGVLCMLCVPERNWVYVSTSTREIVLFEVQGGGGGHREVAVAAPQVAVSAMAAVRLAANRYELWCGNQEGGILVFEAGSLQRETGGGMSHFNVLADQRDGPSSSQVSLLVGDPMQWDKSKAQRNVWSSISQGCCVYKWDVSHRTQGKRLDCLKCLMGGPKEGSTNGRSGRRSVHSQSSILKVTALLSLDGWLYIGTDNGYLIVADNQSMVTSCSIQCHQGEVYSILPLNLATTSPAEMSSSDDEGDNIQCRDILDGEIPKIVTIGRGYKHLLSTVAPSSPHSPNNTDSTVVGLENQDSQEIFLLTFHAANWADFRSF